jgi:uncharacterized protein
MEEILASIRKIIAEEPIGTRPGPDRRSPPPEPKPSGLHGEANESSPGGLGFSDAVSGRLAAALNAAPAVDADDDMADLVDNTPSLSGAPSPPGNSASGAKSPEAPRSPLWFLQRPAHSPVGPLFARQARRSTLEPGELPSAQPSQSDDAAKLDTRKTEGERPRIGDSEATKLPNASDGFLAAKISEATIAPITRGAAPSATPHSEVRPTLKSLSVAAETAGNNARAEVLSETKVGTGAAERRSETASATAVTGASAVVAAAGGASGSPSQTSQPRTLEDAVADLLRPMLKQWLDTNMPRIVEKALRVELAQKADKTPL